jgi:hypothetical protein
MLDGGCVEIGWDFFGGPRISEMDADFFQYNSTFICEICGEKKKIQPLALATIPQ